MYGATTNSLFLTSFPGLLDLDVSTIFTKQNPFIYSIFSASRIPTTTLNLLAFASAEMTLQRLTIRYPRQNKTFRFRRLNEGETDVHGYSFDVELWHEW